jgi:predicted transcriptional regulator YdeE
MEIYIQQEDIRLYGIHVKTFPVGIKESFDSLMEAFGDSQSYYGISWVAEDGSIQYYASVSVPDYSEANPANYERLLIPKGKYATSTIFDWLSKTESVKDVFQELLGDTCPDKERACIEWYKSDEEMLCMIRMD